MTESLYSVKTGSFEGPLEVLLNLIEKRKLFINEISLGSITEDYISYVASIPNKNVADYSSFISVASTLILIKSRSLIPNLALTAEEESDVTALERRLELYKLIREIGEDLKKKFGKEIIFPRLPSKIEIKVFAPDKNITSANMQILAKDLLRAIPVEVEAKPEVVVLKIRSLEEVINDLSERIQKAVSMSFREFSRAGSFNSPKEEKVNVIVSFLAMLELVRGGLINAEQGDDFEEISLEKRN